MRLFLCEKPSQGKDIARVLGASQRGAGCYNGPGITVTWCIGHLIEAAPPEAYGEHYRRWSIEQLPVLPERWRIVVKASTAVQFKIVKQLVGQAGELVIAIDADREGEMIAREIIDLCGYRGPIQRLWLSALNDVSIRKALDALRPAADTLPPVFFGTGSFAGLLAGGHEPEPFVHHARVPGRLWRRVVGGSRADADAEGDVGQAHRACRLPALRGQALSVHRETRHRL